MSETLGAVKVQAEICNLSQESKQTELFLSTSIVYSVALLLVGLRIAGKIVTKHLSLDDWIVIAALILLALPVGCVLAMTKIGFGKHLWALEDGQLLRILRYCKSGDDFARQRTNIYSLDSFLFLCPRPGHDQNLADLLLPRNFHLTTISHVSLHCSRLHYGQQCYHFLFDYIILYSRLCILEPRREGKVFGRTSSGVCELRIRHRTGRYSADSTPIISPTPPNETQSQDRCRFDVRDWHIWLHRYHDSAEGTSRIQDINRSYLGLRSVCYMD